jgi:protein tyrosine phosphatase/predicted kinase
MNIGILLMSSILNYSDLLSVFPIENRVSIDKNIEQEITDELSKDLKANSQRQPILLLFGGFQGSGKSSLIARIKNVYDANIISTDVIRQSLFDKGVRVSPKFSENVKNIYRNLVEKSLNNQSNIFIDANAHSKRIEEIENLLKENNSNHLIVKILLDAPNETLVNRVQMRKPIPGVYQGTESDLNGSLSSIEIDPKEYDLVVDTNKITEKEVFDLVNYFIYPYFSSQNPEIKNDFLHMIVTKDSSFLSFVEIAMNKMKQTIHELAKTNLFFQKDWKSQCLEIEHRVITSLDQEVLEPNRRSFKLGIDRSPEHLPFAYNQFHLQSGELVSASKINLSAIDSTCPDMIAAQAPMPDTITRFWSMVVESNSNIIVMLTNLEERRNQEKKIKCTRYWPEKIGETLFLEGYGQVSLLSSEHILNEGGEELWHSTLQIKAGGIERTINHYWLKGWEDGKGLKSLKLQDALIEQMYQNVKNNPGSPPIIHCTSGVGRTGTIIGSYLAKHLLVWSQNKKTLACEESLPFAITLYLRHQRSHLLHTLDQYVGFHRFIQTLKPALLK